MQRTAATLDNNNQHSVNQQAAIVIHDDPACFHQQQHNMFSRQRNPGRPASIPFRMRPAHLHSHARSAGHERSAISITGAVAATAAALLIATLATACKRSPNNAGQSSTRQGIDANTSRILESMDEYAARLQAEKDAGIGEFAPDNKNDTETPPDTTTNPDQPEEPTSDDQPG